MTLERWREKDLSKIERAAYQRGRAAAFKQAARMQRTEPIASDEVFEYETVRVKWAKLYESKAAAILRRIK